MTPTDRKLTDLYAEEADLLARLLCRLEPATRKAYAARLKVVRDEIARLSDLSFDEWDAARVTEEGEP